jgi:cytochrome P450
MDLASQHFGPFQSFFAFIMLLSFLFFFVLLVILYFVNEFLYKPYQLFLYYKSLNIPGLSHFHPIRGVFPVLQRYIREERQIHFFKDFADRLKNKSNKNIELLFTQLGPSPQLFLLSPRLIQLVIKNSGMKLRKSRFYHRVLGYILGDKNLIISDEPLHSTNRKIISPAFHYQNLHSMMSVMIEESNRMIEQWKLTIPTGQSIDLKEEFHRLTLRIICRSAFGSGFDNNPEATAIMLNSTNNSFQLAFKRALFQIDQIPLINKLPIFQKRELDGYLSISNDFVNNLIAERKAGRSKSCCSGPDLLDQLLSTELTQEQIKQESMAFVVAGHETTSNMLNWLFYELVKQPQLWNACVQEVNSVLPNSEAELTPLALSQLKLIEAVIKETLRYWPSVFAIQREISSDIMIPYEGKEILLPKGAEVGLNIFYMHRNNDLFPRADIFDPYRWLDENRNKPDNSNLTNSFAYLPFAVGNRNCIGQNFALLESKIIVTQILRSVNLILEPGQKIVGEVIVTLRMKYGLKVKVAQTNI